MKNRKQISCLLFTASCFLLATDLAAEETIANVFGGIRTRTNCIEKLNSLGQASLVFETAIPKSYTEDDSMNGDFYWDAILVSPATLSVNVKLHCVRLKLPAMKGVSEEPWIALYAELVKR